jgi:hypothetical protein
MDGRHQLWLRMFLNQWYSQFLPYQGRSLGDVLPLGSKCGGEEKMSLLYEQSVILLI